MKHSFFLLALLLNLFAAQAQEDLYQLEHIVEVRMKFTQPNWHETLDSLKERGHDERMICDLTVDGVHFPETGIRYKGNSSYFNVRNAGGRKLPFNLKVNYVNKDARLKGGFETLKLSNVFRDPSFMREVLAYDIARKYLPAPHANFAKVYINDEYIGLYNLTESVDNDFLRKFYGSKKGTFVKCDPSWHDTAPSMCKGGNNASLEYLGQDSVCYYSLYELKSSSGWSDLIKLTQRLKHKPNELHEHMNINEVLWMHAFNNVVVNLDSYLGRLCHNYYLFQDTNQVWHPVIWDMNLCFGGFRYTGIGGPLSNTAMQEMSLFTHYKEDNQKRPLVVQLLKNDHYRKIYLAHVRTIVEENFSNNWYKERIEHIRNLISNEVADDINKLYTQEDYEKNVNETVRIGNSSIIGLTELMDNRAAKILAHPLMQKPAPVIREVKHFVEGDRLDITAELSDVSQCLVYYRTAPHGPWKSIEMVDNGNEQWSIQLPMHDVLNYYLVAENKYTASCSPARAGMEYHDVKEN